MLEANSKKFKKLDGQLHVTMIRAGEETMEYWRGTWDQYVADGDETE